MCALDFCVAMRCLLVVRAPGCSSTRGAIPLSDTHILPLYYTFTTLLWYDFGKKLRRLNGLEMATMQAVVYIGDKLKALRIEQALTRGELAEKAGVALNTVARLERNETEPHMPTARKLAAALGVEPRRLTKTEE